MSWHVERFICSDFTGHPSSESASEWFFPSHTCGCQHMSAYVRQHTSAFIFRRCFRVIPVAHLVWERGRESYMYVNLCLCVCMYEQHTQTHTHTNTHTNTHRYEFKKICWWLQGLGSRKNDALSLSYIALSLSLSPSLPLIHWLQAYSIHITSLPPYLSLSRSLSPSLSPSHTQVLSIHIRSF